MNFTIGPTVLASATAWASVLFSARTLTVPLLLMSRPSPMAAVDVESATVTATAPATCTFWLWPFSSLAPASALSVEPVLPLPPLLLARWSAKLRLSFFCLLTPPSSSSGEPSSGASSCAPPATLALALLLALPVERAVKATAPPAIRSRAVLALTTSVAMVRPREMPTPVSPEVVSPATSVAAEPACVALTVTAPPKSVSGPAFVPRPARVSLLATVMPRMGVTAVSPLEPPSTRVSTWLRLAALSSSASAPPTLALLPIRASVSVMDTLSAKAAPTPVVAASASCLPEAVTEEAMKFSAWMLTSPPVTVTGVSAFSSALALVTTTPRARAPATPVSPPLAPAMASTV